MHNNGKPAVATYLVEHYRPGAQLDALEEAAARLGVAAAAMAREGKAVSHVQATIVPHDEALLCVLVAVSEELVRELYARADVPCERISAAVSVEKSTT